MDLTRRNFLKAGAAAGLFGLGAASLTGCGTPETVGKEETSGEQSSNEYDDKSWLGEAPVLTPADCEETKECEVLIVGSALSGSMAAYGALKNGAQVTVIERNGAPHIGGMTISFLNSETQLSQGLPEGV